MKTDTLFYKLFASFKSLIFELIDRPFIEGYRFISAEVKEKAFRFDGIFISDAIEQPIIFLEVQFQPKPDFYWEFLAEIFIYLNQYRPKQDWKAVAIFAKYSLEPAPSIQHQELIASGRIVRVYLEDWTERETNSTGISIIQLILAPEPKVHDIVRKLTSQTDRDGKIVQFIETVLVYKFPKLSRAEVEAMFTLSDLKQTRVYQEAFQEGEVSGELRALLRLLNRKFGQIGFESSEQIAKFSISQLDDLAEAILDFNTLGDLTSWLQSQIL